MEFKEPLKIYTAATNVEAHLIVVMLETNGIEAFAEEDQSGVSQFAFGTLSQFHQPNVWIDKSAAKATAELIRGFEERKRERAKPDVGNAQIQVECEECGKVSSFSKSLNGTVQDCSHCRAYVDVGELDWDVDFGEPEE
jgi:hypothetical protein